MGTPKEAQGSVSKGKIYHALVHCQLCAGTVEDIQRPQNKSALNSVYWSLIDKSHGPCSCYTISKPCFNSPCTLYVPLRLVAHSSCSSHPSSEAECPSQQSVADEGCSLDPSVMGPLPAPCASLLNPADRQRKAAPTYITLCHPAGTLFLSSHWCLSQHSYPSHYSLLECMGCTSKPCFLSRRRTTRGGHV